MNRKIVRVLGKRGRITIPYEIRVRNKIGNNDILSFEEKDKNTIHPHIHLISYSAGKEPYMTEQALQTFKSDFAREIFKNDLYHTYQDMTAHRNELRRTGRDKIAEIVQQMVLALMISEVLLTRMTFPT